MDMRQFNGRKSKKRIIRLEVSDPVDMWYMHSFVEEVAKKHSDFLFFMYCGQSDSYGMTEYTNGKMVSYIIGNLDEIEGVDMKTLDKLAGNYR